MSNFQDLPDELILKILSYLEIKALLTCGQISKRIRKISHDNSLWVTANLEKKIVKTKLLEMILGKECRSLNLCHSTILGSLNSTLTSQLRVLDISQPVTMWPAKEYVLDAYRDREYCAENNDVVADLLFSCGSLQHLAMEGIQLTPEIADGICNNGKTLQILNLNCSSVDELWDLSELTYSNVSKPRTYFEEIFAWCQELKEVHINEVEGIDVNDDREVLVRNIPPNVEKLNLSNIHFSDDHVKILVSRCNKIKALSLNRWTTDVSLKNIRHHLNLTLEELSLTASSTEEDRGRFSSPQNASLWFDAILELKSMSRLRCLNLYSKLPHFDHLHPITTYPPGFENLMESQRILNNEYWKELYKQGIDQFCQYLRQHLPHLTITTFFINSL